MLSTLMDKVDSMQKQMGNVSGEMEILRTKKNTGDFLKSNRNKKCYL